MGEAENIAARYRRRAGLPPGRYTFFEPGNLFLIHQRERLLLRLLAGDGLDDLGGARILEVGCGDGWWLRKFAEWGARPENLLGVELLPDRVERARSLNPGIKVDLGDASRLGQLDGSFDIVLQSTVFSSILDAAMRREVAGEMLRVLRPGGAIIWYDLRMDNPGNPDVGGVGRREIESLFPGCGCRFHRTTLAPPLARRLAPVSWALCHLLSKLPMLLTHYLVIISKPVR
jgi:SAM-dependent methyltransferase